MAAIAIPNLTAAPDPLATSDEFVISQAGAEGYRSTLGDVWDLFRATGGTFTAGIHVRLASYTVAGLPAVSPAGQLIYVSDEVGGGVPAWSNGTNWLRVTDGAIVS